MPRSVVLLLISLGLTSSVDAQSIGNCAPRVVLGSPTTDAGDGGPALQAQFFGPSGLAKDAAGNLYVADSGNNKVRVIRTDGTVRTIAGTGVPGSAGDGGAAASAQLNSPIAVAIEPDGSLYVVEQAGGVPATKGYLTEPSGLVFGADGTLYIAARSQIKSVTPDGLLHAVAGQLYDSNVQPAEGVSAIQASLQVLDMALDAKGNLLFIQAGFFLSNVERLWRIGSDGNLHGVVDTYPGQGLVIESDGTFIRSAGTASAIMKYTPALPLTGVVSPNVTFAGVPPRSNSGDGGPGTLAGLFNPGGIAADSAGNIFVADSWAGRIRKIDVKGIVTTVAGAAGSTPTPDGIPALQSVVNYPTAIAISRSGELYYSEPYNYHVRKIGTDGMVTTVAGNGAYPDRYTRFDVRDGAKAKEATLRADWLALDGNGNLYIADSASSVIWRVTPDGVLHLVVQYTITGYPINNHPLATDPSGTVYYLDSPDSYTLNLVRIDAGSSTEVVRSIGHYFNPQSFAIDGAGNLFLPDQITQRIFKAAIDGTVSILTNTTVVPAVALLASVALDPAGNLFAADTIRARVIEVPSATACTASVFPLMVAQGPLNAAGYQASGLAPGEIVDIFGVVVGPQKPALGSVDSSGRLKTAIAGTQVLFDGIPAPLIYASSRQSTAIVPFGVAGQQFTNVQVVVNGFLSNALTMWVADASPGIFTRDASGSGQGAILNQDYSVNSAARPARIGSTVMVYTTGLGLLNPPVPDGAITGAAFSRQVWKVTAQVRGLSADVLYAGTAPGLVAGVSQVNVSIPPGTPSGSASIVIVVGQDASSYRASQNAVTIAVQ